MAASTKRKRTSKRSPKTARTSTTVSKTVRKAKKTARSAMKKATAPTRRKTAKKAQARKAGSRKSTGPGIVKRLKDAISHIPIVGNVVDTKS